MKRLIPFLVFAFFLSIFLVFKSCIVQNPKPEECEVVEVTIKRITEGSTYDIVFHNDDKNLYYINRGLEQGLNLDSLNAKVLNKTVTLHLAKVLVGMSTTNHIAQMALGDEIIFTEFD